MRVPRRIGMFATAIAMLAGEALAGKPQTWRQDSAKDFLAGERTRLVAGSDGRLRLAREIATVGEVPASQIWSIAPDGQGGAYVATGNPGSVVRVDTAGKSTVRFKQEKAQVFALAAAADGVVFAATSPDGRIHKLEADGKSSVFCNVDAKYVWSMNVDAAGNIYAATGLPARVMKITPDGKFAVLLQPKTTHVLSLAVDDSGTVYAGTSDRGLIYRISPDGKTFVLYDAPQADVKVLTLDQNGTLYAGTASGEKSSKTGSSNRGDGSFELTDARKSDVDAKVTVSAGKGNGPIVRSAKPDASKSESESSSAPAFASAANPGENSVYRITADGAVEEIFREKALVLGLAVQADRLIVGTGHEGKLFEVDLKSNFHGEWARLEHGELAAFAVAADGVVLCGGTNPGKLYRLENRFVDRGELLSSVHDAKLLARWGRQVASFETPVASKLELNFRCGNVAKPDDTWSFWESDPTKLPAARYCQYRAKLSSPDGNATPSLASLQVYFATVNRPPVVESIEVPDLVKSPFVGPNGKLKLKWKATDANGDALTFAVAVRRDSWPDWVVVARDLSATEYEWDAAAVPSGNYRLRVEASDRTVNSDGDARTASKSSESFIVDRTAPTVRLNPAKVTDRRIVVDMVAEDSQTRLTAAAFSVDGKNWTPLFPDSGLLDSASATMTVRTERLEPGLHLVLVRAEDSAGNLGVADATVRVD